MISSINSWWKVWGEKFGACESWGNPIKLFALPLNCWANTLRFCDLHKCIQVPKAYMSFEANKLENNNVLWLNNRSKQ